MVRITKKIPECNDYHDSLIKRLKDRDYAIAYLNAALEESVECKFKS